MSSQFSRPGLLRRMQRPLLAASMAFMLMTSVTPAYADTIDPNDPAAVAARKAAVDAQLQTVTGSVDGLTVEVASAYTELNKTETQIPVARANLENAQKDLAAAQEKDKATGTRLAAAQTEEKSLVAAVAASQTLAKETKQTIGRIAVDAYKGQTANASLDLVFGSKSAQDYAEGTVLYDIAVEKQSTKANTLGAQASSQQNSTARLTAVRSQITELKKVAEANVKAMADAQTKAAAAKTALDTLYATQKSQAALLEQQKTNSLTQQASLTAEQAALDAQMKVLVQQALDAQNALRASQGQSALTADQNTAAAVAANPTGSWGFTRPVEAPVTSEFSSGRLHPIYGITRAHEGIDLGAPCGAPIKAAIAGTVTLARYNGGGGNSIWIKTDNYKGVAAMFMRYLHQTNFAPGIQVGSVVQAGQVIGYVGSTGGSTGCHLHWEVRPNDVAQNPRNFMNF